MPNGMLTTIKTWVGGSMELLSAYGPALRHKITILAFHRVCDGEDPIGINYRVDAFERLCAFLSRNTRVVPLRQQVEALHGAADAGGTISITFDDGYLDNFTAAAPILERYGLTATFFVVSDFIDSSVVPWWDGELKAKPEWMTWSHLEQLLARGFEIGCHTKTHADLARISENEVREELLKSRAALRERLGIAADLFAYPYGGARHMTDPRRAIVRELGFKCCLSSHGGTNAVNADPFSLFRVPINFWYRTPQQFGCDLVLNRVGPQIETSAHDSV